MVMRTMFHEAVHGMQLPQSTATQSGRSFGEAFGVWWGTAVEPWADGGSFVISRKLFAEGLISEGQYREIMGGGLAELLNLLGDREELLQEVTLRDAPHVVGAAMLLGAFYQVSGIREGEDALLSWDADGMASAAEQLIDGIIGFAASGDIAGFSSWVRATIEYLPRELAQEIMRSKGTLKSYTLIDRYDLRIPTELR
jgi:hypothetical protein